MHLLLEGCMRTILIAYVILINLIGFIMMGIDKRKSIRRSWRIPEKRLFLVALLFGSIGILIGMYVFHHKTRHLSFAIGIPAILVVQLLALSLLFTWNNQRLSSPSQIVQHELELIEELDSATIQSFVSYENLTNSRFVSEDIGEETAEAVNLFFKHFRYSIQQEQIDGANATVSVNIQNIDMKALAQDLCTGILLESVTIYPDSVTVSTTNDYYRLLRDTLQQNTYESVVTTAYFHLQQDEHGWYILADQTLEDELVSGFISYMNDPYLLSAASVLSIHLDAMKELDGPQWADYLDIEDVFATYNTDYYAQIDEAYTEQIAEYFDYEILKCTETGSTATAVVRITSLDMTGILENYRSKLLTYAATTHSIRDDDVTFSNKTAQMLLEALQENTASCGTDITMTIPNDGTTWAVSFNSDFTNALMGDMKGAIDTFNAVTTESLS